MLFVGLLAAAVASGPIYLSCSFPNASAPLVVDATMDEANQRVIIGQTGKTPAPLVALFSPTTVTAVQHIGRETQTWIFDRVNLSVQTVTSFTEGANKGTCRVVPAPAARAF